MSVRRVPSSPEHPSRGYVVAIGRHAFATFGWTEVRDGSGEPYAREVVLIVLRFRVSVGIVRRMPRWVR